MYQSKFYDALIQSFDIDATKKGKSQMYVDIAKSHALMLFVGILKNIEPAPTPTPTKKFIKIELKGDALVRAPAPTTADALVRAPAPTTPAPTTPAPTTPAPTSNLSTGLYYLKGGNKNNYCKNLDIFNCNSINAGPSEITQIINLGNGYYNLKNNSGKFCSDDRKDKFECNRSYAGPWEKTQIIDLGNGYYNLKGGQNNNFCSDDSDGYFKCNRDIAGPWERIQIIPIPSKLRK
jgi:hypothetical protein